MFYEDFSEHAPRGQDHERWYREREMAPCPFCGGQPVMLLLPGEGWQPECHAGCAEHSLTALLEWIGDHASEDEFPLDLRPNADLAQSDWNAMVAFYHAHQPVALAA